MFFSLFPPAVVQQYLASIRKRDQYVSEFPKGRKSGKHPRALGCPADRSGRLHRAGRFTFNRVECG